MTFVVSYGPLNDEVQVNCETAGEALKIVTDLMAKGRKNIVVTQFQTGDVAVEVLQVLAQYENSGDGR